MCMGFNGFNPWCQAQCLFRATEDALLKQKQAKERLLLFAAVPQKWCLVYCSWSRARLGLFSWIFRIKTGMQWMQVLCFFDQFLQSDSVTGSYKPVSSEGSTIKNVGHLSVLSCTFQEYQILKRYQEDLHDASQFYTWQERMKEQAGIRSLEILDLSSAWNDFWTRWTPNWAPAIDIN